MARHHALLSIRRALWGIPIPELRGVVIGERAEEVAAAVDLDGLAFHAPRRKVREALDADGVAAEINTAVTALLDHEVVDPSGPIRGS